MTGGSMTDSELKTLASQNARTDPRPGTQWRRSEDGEVFEVTVKPIDPETFEPLVCYWQSGRVIYCAKVSWFLAEVQLPDGSTVSRFEAVDPFA